MHHGSNPVYRDYSFQVDSSLNTPISMSPTPSPPYPQSIGPLRSRRGCKACKTRKIKCDQQKPSCRRCIAARYTCEYPEQTTYGYSYASAPSITTTPILDTRLSTSPSTVMRERRAFAYYFYHAAPYLAGGLDQSFWTVTVPRICRVETAVWDAVNAISTLFEFPEMCLDFVFLRHEKTNSSLTDKQSEALGWYSRSLSKIQSGIARGNLNVQVALVSCVLFICIEMVQGRAEEALGLYGQGVQLIHGLRAKARYAAQSASDADFLETTIVPLFVRLGTAALGISGVPICDLFSGLDSQHRYLFGSLEDARDALIPLAAEVQIFRRDTGRNPFIPGPQGEPVIPLSSEAEVALARAERERLQERLNAWFSAYTALTTQPQSAKNIPSAATSNISSSIRAILLTFHATLSTILATSLSQTACTYDEHLSAYRTIIEQATIALESLRKPDGTQPVFTFELGVGLPLFWTALTCREPGIRREALGLLRIAPQMQGFSKAQVGLALAGRIMQLEEGFAREILPKTPQPGALLTPPYDSTGGKEGPETTVTNMDIYIPEEARIQHYTVFRPRDQPHILGPHEHDISKWERSPDQLFLRFTRNQWDEESGGWVLSDECVPMTPD
ncbi:hypothetical protein BDV10DRAFT_163340 [Aspergillus recurvatus]